MSRAFASNILLMNATMVKGSPRIVQQTCYGLDDAGHPAEAGRSSSTVVYHSPDTKSNEIAFRTQWESGTFVPKIGGGRLPSGRRRCRRSGRHREGSDGSGR